MPEEHAGHEPKKGKLAFLKKHLFEIVIGVGGIVAAWYFMRKGNSTTPSQMAITPGQSSGGSSGGAGDGTGSTPTPPDLSGLTDALTQLGTQQSQSEQDILAAFQQSQQDNASQYGDLLSGFQQAEQQAAQDRASQMQDLMSTLQGSSGEAKGAAVTASDPTSAIQAWQQANSADEAIAAQTKAMQDMLNQLRDRLSQTARVAPPPVPSAPSSVPMPSGLGAREVAALHGLPSIESGAYGPVQSPHQKAKKASSTQNNHRAIATQRMTQALKRL